jgi:fumarate hydratase class II
VSESHDNYSEFAREELEDRIAIGGTAVGTGMNTHPDFATRVADALTRRTRIEFHQDAGPKSNASKDNFIQAHGYLKTIAVSLSKIANDIRLMGSGPRCGIGELMLPAIQPGSSIMPGKVNPVLCESVMQVCCRVIGNDATITMAGMGGVGSIFELSVAMPVMIDAFLESVTLLSNVCNVFAEKVIDGLEADEKRCRELLERSLMNVTALAPVLGYDACASMAKQAHAEDKSIRQVVLERGLMDEAKLNELLDYEKMTRPSV